MHDKLSFDFFDSCKFFIFFSGSVMNKIKLFTIINRKFNATSLTSSFQNAEDDMVSAI